MRTYFEFDVKNRKCTAVPRLPVGGDKRKCPDASPQEAVRCRPFVKWAGGKSQLISELTRRLPPSFNNYFEPFVGGGALFFHLLPEKAFLSDINEELVNAYLAVRDNVEGLLRALRRHRYEKEYYYSVRAWDRDSRYRQRSPLSRAARLIYLNKTCYNGLYRVNSNGHFNVPFGDYTNPAIADSRNLRLCSKALSCAQITVQCYLDMEGKARKGDLIYLDPPYAPLSTTSLFTSYTKAGFDVQDQIALRDLCRRLDKKGVFFMASNSSAPLILDLYREFNLQFVEAHRFVNSKADARGRIKEVIVTNY